MWGSACIKFEARYSPASTVLQKDKQASGQGISRMMKNCLRRSSLRLYSCRDAPRRFIPIRVIAQIVVATGWMLMAGGCTHVLLYNEGRDKQAQDTNKAVTAAHIADTVAGMEKSFADVAAREEASARDQETYLFDQELQLVARARSLDARFVVCGTEKNVPCDAAGGPDGLLTVVNNRLKDLGLFDDSTVNPKTPTARAAADAKLNELRTADVNIATTNKALATTIIETAGTLGHRFDNCTDIYAASRDAVKGSNTPTQQFLDTLDTHEQKLIAGGKLEALVGLCQQIEGFEDTRESLFSGGLISMLAAHVKNTKAKISEYASQETTAGDDLKKAIAEFDTEQKATLPGKSRLEALQASAQSLQDKINSILENGGAAASHVVATQRLDHLIAILGAIAAKDDSNASGQGSGDKIATDPKKDPLSKDNSAYVALIRGLPQLADTADQLFAEAQKPRLVPLLAAIDNQKLLIQGLESRRTARLKVLDAAQNHLDAAMAEGLALARIRQSMTKQASWASLSINDLEDKFQGDKNTADRNDIHRALAIYADEVQQARVDAAVWETREIAARYEEGLAQSKSAAAQWDNLMDTLAKVLADYHASGIKQSDIAEFLKALGLVVIGVGVN